MFAILDTSFGHPQNILLVPNKPAMQTPAQFFDIVGCEKLGFQYTGMHCHAGKQ